MTKSEGPLTLEPIVESRMLEPAEIKLEVCDADEGGSMLGNMFGILKATFPMRVWILLIGLTFLYLYPPSADAWFKKGFALGCTLIIFSIFKKSGRY